MAYLYANDLPVIILSGLAGAAVGLLYTELLLGLSPLPEAVNLCAVGILPALGGWLSSNARNVFAFPVCILIGISAALPTGKDSFALLFILAAATLQGAAATATFFVGWGGRRLLARRKQ